MRSFLVSGLSAEHSTSTFALPTRRLEPPLADGKKLDARRVSGSALSSLCRRATIPLQPLPTHVGSVALTFAEARRKSVTSTRRTRCTVLVARRFRQRIVTPFEHDRGLPKTPDARRPD